jgi:hypothetical protein
LHGLALFKVWSVDRCTGWFQACRGAISVGYIITALLMEQWHAFDKEV